uniref:RNA binding motif protein 25 n=1 Tax=Varanus komodoensis TaxID=61221 RepID=A0A8D2IWM1_VARKO
ALTLSLSDLYGYHWTDTINLIFSTNFALINCPTNLLSSHISWRHSFSFFQVLVPTAVSMVGKHMGVRKEHPGLKNKENDENSGPTTTVFVGNISEKASDMLIRQLLAPLGFASIKNQNLHYVHSDYCMISKLEKRNYLQRKGLPMGYDHYISLANKSKPSNQPIMLF